MNSKDILLPSFCLEVKKSKSQPGEQTFSLNQLEKIDFKSFDLLYKNRSRFRNVVKLMDRICYQGGSGNIDLTENRFFIDAYSRQDGYSTMLYILHRLKESRLCNCSVIYKGRESDLKCMSECDMSAMDNMNNSSAAMNENNWNSGMPVPDWRQDKKSAVFFMSDSNNAGPMNLSGFPSAQGFNYISNPAVFLINIMPDEDSTKNSNSSGFMKQGKAKNTFFDYILNGFKYIKTGKLDIDEMASLFSKYLSSSGYKNCLSVKEVKNSIISFRKTLSCPVREQDVKSFGDSVINNHKMSRINPSEKLITEASLDIPADRKKEATKRQKAPVQNPWRELDNIIGMEDIKTEIQNLVNRLKLEDKRRKLGLPASGINMNAVFLGSPGTNKTSIARLLARILAFEKIIPDANFRECGKEDIVGQYVGWTAVKVKELFNSLSRKGTSGGILFIDEAYSITDAQTSFDREAVSTLVQCMENFRSHVMVIFGGYKQKMLEFMGKNEGLRSRISFVLEFKGYSNKELVEITKYQASLSGFNFEEGCEEEITDYFEILKGIRGDNFGNGREARTLYEYASLELSARLSQKKVISKDDLILITREDMKNAIRKAIERERAISGGMNKRAIGFL